MIFHDTVHLSWRVDTGQEDAYGNQIFDEVDTDARAIVWPLDTNLSVPATGPGASVGTRYRIAVKPLATPIPLNVGASLKVQWREYTTAAGFALTIDGAIERHTVHGRLHHYEMTTRVVSGA